MILYLKINFLRCHIDIQIKSSGGVKSSGGGVVLLGDADLQSSGAKAAACGRLSSLAAASSKGTANSCVLFFEFNFLLLELKCFISGSQ